MSLNLTSYTVSLGMHNQKKVIWIAFSKDPVLINNLRTAFPAARWSATHRMWYLPDMASIRSYFHIPLATFDKHHFSKISPQNQVALQHFTDTLTLKGYSANTLRSYTTEFLHLLTTLKAHAVSDLSPEKLRSYFLYCHKELNMTENHLHARVNAIKFYFEQVLHRPAMFFEIPRPQKPSSLPKVISTHDIKKLFSVVENPKHLLMLKLCYGMGLRVSEIAKLKIADIDSKRMQVLIACAKGKKDRYVPLPQETLAALRAYYQSYKPKEYLFEGQYVGAISVRSIQAVFKSAMEKAKIKKAVGIHSLRHSYATHLLEYGTDITLIQKLLGHNDLKTTMLYAKVSNVNVEAVKSPLDRLSSSD